MSDSAGNYVSNSDSLPQMDDGAAGGRGYNPISELMRAIILRTIDDFNSVGPLHDEAIVYMFDEDDEYIFSFYGICRHLGFDPARTRYSIMNPVQRISTRRRAA